ncbi:MAG: methionine sulfoxide reductase A [Thiotrichales bacterium SG8_50]|nr:MAG: methionine sulfoxide reductase A [Thiotrichales bacterium SG8_50]
MFVNTAKSKMIDPAQALPGRDEPIPVPDRHFVNGHSMVPPYPDGMEKVIVGLGCFWGAERCFWQQEGVYVTAVGYAAGYTPNPTYEEVCTGMTGHNEVVLVVYDPDIVPFEQILSVFWEAHDPTQGMRQGNDVGTQYRSGIYVYSDGQKAASLASLDRYQARLSAAGYPTIMTEILDAPQFYFAEHYHQQYLAKNPGGYCGLGGTGVNFAPATED